MNEFLGFSLGESHMVLSCMELFYDGGSEIDQTGAQLVR